MMHRVEATFRLWILLASIGAIFLEGCGEVGRVRLIDTPKSDMVEVPDEVLRASQSELELYADGAPTVLYLNFDGAKITRASKSDAASNTSFIGGGTVPPFSGDQSVRDTVTAQVKKLYEAFNISIVTTRPTSGNYDMAMVGGSPSNLGLSYGSGVLGVGPMDCGNRMPRDIAFIFANNIKSVTSSSKYPYLVAETIAHEAGHTYGLPHSGDGCDLMSYGQCANTKTFLDKKMPMQSDSQGSCGMYSMNSYQLLLEALGPRDPNQPDPADPEQPKDTEPPQVQITSPANNATIAEKVIVKANVTDNTEVDTVEILVDGKSSGSKIGMPYEFDLTLVSGQHTLTVLATDIDGNQGQASVEVKVQGGDSEALPTTQPDSNDATLDTDNNPNATPMPGEFGAACKQPADCHNSLCAEGTIKGEGFCTQACDPNSNTCPLGGSCLPVNESLNVCSLPQLKVITDEDTDPNADPANPAGQIQGDDRRVIGGCTLSPFETESNGLWLFAMVWGFVFLASKRKS